MTSRDDDLRELHRELYKCQTALCNAMVSSRGLKRDPELVDRVIRMYREVADARDAVAALIRGQNFTFEKGEGDA
jgi:hypothetical protein